MAKRRNARSKGGKEAGGRDGKVREKTEERMMKSLVKEETERRKKEGKKGWT